MLITIQPTTAFHHIDADSIAGTVPARLWIGELDTGQVVHCLIVAVATEGVLTQKDFQAHLVTRPPESLFNPDQANRLQVKQVR